MDNFARCSAIVAVHHPKTRRHKEAISRILPPSLPSTFEGAASALEFSVAMQRRSHMQHSRIRGTLTVYEPAHRFPITLASQPTVLTA